MRFLDRFGPTWMHSSRAVRQDAVAKLTSQAILAHIAKTDEDAVVRKAAVWKVTNLAILAHIAKTDEDAGVRKAAVRKVTNQALLARFATTDSDSDVRLEAAGRLTDQALAQAIFADLAKTHPSPHVRIQAAQRLTDQTLSQATFAEIAKTAYDRGLRRTALDRLSDETLLVYLVKTAQPEVRVLAGNKLGDATRAALQAYLAPSALLAEAAKNGQDGDVRLAAAKNLTDPAALADLAMCAKDPAVVQAAVLNPNLTDQAVLAEVAKNGNDGDVRLAAARKLTDPAALADVAMCAKDRAAVKAAIRNPNLTDQAVLAEVAKTGWGSHFYERTDGDYAYPGDYLYYEGWYAADKLTDRTLLADVARNAEDDTVRRLAERRLLQDH